VLIWAVVMATGAHSGWVFFGLPDLNTPASMIHNYPDKPYPESPDRNNSVVDMLSRIHLSDDNFEAAKSARFEFGERK
jgi:hypothetical protein